MPLGAAPTLTGADAVPLDGSIRVTVPSRALATQTDPAPTATADGPLPTLIVWTTRLVAALMRETDLASLLATQTAPKPTARPVGPSPTSTVCTTVRVRVSIRDTVPSV